MRWALTLIAAAAFGGILAALQGLSRLEGVRLALATIFVAAVSLATDKWLDRLQARSALLHGLVLFAGGVALTALLFVAGGDRPTPFVLYAGLLVALSGRKRRPRKPDEDWIDSPSGTRETDGRRWRTGTP